MKVILTGSTGFVGQEVLIQCLSNPTITSIVVLSRRELSISHPKLTVQIMTHNDFLSYSDSQLTGAMQGADACIWCIGTVPSFSGANDDARRVNVEYVDAAAKAFQRACAAKKDEGKKFRFVYVSGGLAERDQGKQLWFASEFRRMRVCVSSWKD